MRFAYPWVILLILFIPLMVHFARKLAGRSGSSIRFSNQDLVNSLKPTVRIFLAKKMIYVRAFALVFLLLALARPQKPIEENRIFVEGINIVISVDCSGSMHAMDFEMGGHRVDRLTVVKSVVEEFIAHRPNDKIGIVAFASLAYTVCPLTLDHEWLDKNLERVQIGMIEDGTAIGSAMTAAINRLKDIEAKDKIIILLTDGRNNAGKISPLSAAEAAKALGIRVYTIGVGTKGLVPYPVKDMFGETVLQQVEIEIDEDLLKNIAGITGAKYFRATDTASLAEIYNEIDKLEKVKIEEVGYNQYEELFGVFLFPALFLLLAEMILNNTLFRRIP